MLTPQEIAEVHAAASVLTFVSILLWALLSGVFRGVDLHHYVAGAVERGLCVQTGSVRLYRSAKNEYVLLDGSADGPERTFDSYDAAAEAFLDAAGID